MTIVVEWNGNSVPDGLRHAPPGRYVLVPVEPEEELTNEEERGLSAALASARRGDTIPAADVRRAIQARLGR